MNFFKAISEVLHQDPVLFVVTIVIVGLSLFAFLFLLFQFVRGRSGKGQMKKIRKRAATAADKEAAVAGLSPKALRVSLRKKQQASGAAMAIALPVATANEAISPGLVQEPLPQPVQVRRSIPPTPPVKVEMYPILRLPPEGAAFMPADPHHRISRGFTEASFEEKIRRAFPAFETASHQCLSFGSGPGYGMDILLQGHVNGKSFYIDIEIDEPYDALQRISMHCLHADSERDDFFMQRGWVVVRFTERQVAREPVRCVAFVGRIIQGLVPHFELPGYLEALPAPAGERQWTTEEAMQWQRLRLREEYLGIARWSV